MLEYNGVSKTLSQWAEEIGITCQGLWRRIFVSKWDVGKALTTPVSWDYITYNGETLRLYEWARKTGIKYNTLERRLHDFNWSPERALTTI
jgi:hypothetical protein